MKSGARQILLGRRGNEIAVYRDLTNNVAQVYVPQTSGPSNAYTEYRLRHHVASDADVWTVSGIWSVVRAGYESFTRVRRLVVENTELLCAIQESGALDFMGGEAHGDEVVTATPTLTVDSQAVSLASGSAGWFHGDTVVLSQTSRMYRVGSSLGTALAERAMTLTFQGRDMTCAQTITGLASWTASNGYFSMFAPHRYESYVNGVSEDNTSLLITGTYIDNTRLTPTAIDARAAQVNEDFAQTTPRITSVSMSGRTGLTFEMEQQSASAAILKDVFLMQKSQYAYNKAYIGFVGGFSGNQAVTAATSWSTTTRYRVSR